ncbi:MAG: exodeoxyribonuclease VII large subunit [Aggregatilineales bacterium]
MPAETIYQIEEVNRRVRNIVERESADEPFWAGGVINGLSESRLGHMYFKLADDGYEIECMVHQKQRGNIAVEPKSGMEVEVYGKIGVYDKRLTVQIMVEQMRVVDAHGIDTTPLEEQLRKLGLYPPTKKALPQVINQIALVTSKQSEANFDFHNNYHGAGKITLQHTPIAGEFAPEQIARTIKRINSEKSADVIVLTRGGGRPSELAIFNDIQIVEAICRSAIPVLTALGHEQNVFFADRVADVSAGTPTAAAVILSQHERPVAQGNDRMETLFIALGAAVLGALVVFVLLNVV